MKNGFLKVAAASPTVHVADPAANLGEHLALYRQARELGARLLVFPALSLSGVSCADLFFSQALCRGVRAALDSYLAETADSDMITVLGAPMTWGGRLYRCTVVCQSGKLLGIVPQARVSTEECRWFASAEECASDTYRFADKEIPFGHDLLFICKQLPCLRLSVLTDLASNAPDSATLLCLPDASAEQVGAVERRRLLLQACTMTSHTAGIYTSAGVGESTTDAVYGGHRMIAENGTLLSEALPFSKEALTVTEIDLERLCADHRHYGLHNPCQRVREVCFALSPDKTELTRKIEPNPFVPACAEELAARCETILSIQAQGLKTRIEKAYAKKLVVGISGGLDSTLALLVMARAIDLLDRPRHDIVAVTMPCFGTTQRTKTNATVLCEELGVDFRTVNIYDAVNLHFRDIGHDPAVRDVTYENSQARERTQILMDIANDCGGMVIGTGDLSELALGWATYNGDHMSMYGVNAALPKTMIRHVVSYCADEAERNGSLKLSTALRDVLDTPVSPELLPADSDGKIAQKTEDLVGPYEIHDFYLYYLLRYGFTPAKLYRMARYALGDRYDNETLLKWLRIFLRRFFNQQFKRSCLPDGPAIGSVGLSPRGAWMMPSDASSKLWLTEAEALSPEN